MKLLQERICMSIDWKKITPYLIGAVGGFALSGALVLHQLQRATGDALEAAKFLYGLGMLRQYFVGELDDNKLYRGALSGLLSATGDPYTVFLDEKDFAAMEEMIHDGNIMLVKFSLCEFFFGSVFLKSLVGRIE